MKLYHITERSNLDSILANGLQPMYDSTLRSRTLDSGTLINLGGRHTIEEVLWSEPYNDPVLLEVSVSRKDLVKLEHETIPSLIWYGCRRPIPPSQIRVVGNPTRLLGYDSWRDSHSFSSIPDPVTEKERSFHEIPPQDKQRTT